jgi:hypothetical protein
VRGCRRRLAPRWRIRCAALVHNTYNPDIVTLSLSLSLSHDVSLYIERHIISDTKVDILEVSGHDVFDKMSERLCVYCPVMTMP